MIDKPSVMDDILKDTRTVIDVIHANTPYYVANVNFGNMHTQDGKAVYLPKSKGTYREISILLHEKISE